MHCNKSYVDAISLFCSQNILSHWLDAFSIWTKHFPRIAAMILAIWGGQQN